MPASTNSTEGLADQFPERLGDPWDLWKRVLQQGVPFRRMAEGVVGQNLAAAMGRAAKALEWLFKVERSVIVGNLVACHNMPPGDFESKSGLRHTAAQDMVPRSIRGPSRKNAVAGAVDVRVPRTWRSAAQA